MDAERLGRLHRLIRHRAGMTQEELSRRAGVARWKIPLLEAGRAAELRPGEVERCFVALGGRLDIRGWYNGAAADRPLDEVHALVGGSLHRLLVTGGWLVQLEVTFSEYGERGSIDVLGWHPVARGLLVGEVNPRSARSRGRCDRSTPSAGWRPRSRGSALGGSR
jgi:hypothetical protein